jgi:lysophospholipase L1-like esterase
LLAALLGVSTVFAADAAPLKFLALGDSYTIGERVAPAERWPTQTVALMRTANLSVADPVYIAKTGWTTSELRGGIIRGKPEGPFDIVSLLIGVNNQYRSLSKKLYRQEFAGLLKRAIQLAGNRPNRVFVLSIPDWSVTSFARGQHPRTIAKEISAFNAISRQETDAVHAHYIDITPVSRAAEKDPGLWAEDGLHPSARQYSQWAETVWPVIQQELSHDPTH